MQVDFDRERDWWDAKAATEEVGGSEEFVNRSLRWREINRRLGGMRSILDVGGGTGRFSIPLARQGYQVTHLDLSPAMLSIARERAGDLPNISFVEGNAVDLGRFADQAFDLVLNTDGAVSFCGSWARHAIEETCRVCRSTVILTVSHKAQMVPSWIVGSYESVGRFPEAVDRMVEHGDWHQQQHPDNALLTKGATQDYMGALHAFLPGEFRSILEGRSMSVIRCGGLGSLAGMCSKEFLGRIAADTENLDKFLGYCEYFDLHILPEGPGTRQRAGLIAVAERASPVRRAGLI